MFNTFVQNSKSIFYTRIMILAHSIIVLLVFSTMPFCCGEYGALICCWIQIHSRRHQTFWKYIYFNLHVCFILHQHIIFFEIFQTLILWLSKDKKCVFSKNVTKYHVPPWIILNLHIRPKPTFLPTYLFNFFKRAFKIAMCHHIIGFHNRHVLKSNSHFTGWLKYYQFINNDEY